MSARPKSPVSTVAPVDAKCCQVAPWSAAQQERRDDEQRQGPELGDGREAGEDRGDLDAADVRGGRRQDGAGRQIVCPARVRHGIHADRPQTVLAEHRRDAAERRGTYEHELRPSVQEGVRSPPSLAQVHVDAAGLGHGGRELCERQGAAENDEPADHPDGQHERRLRHARGDACRRAKDAAADRDAHHDADGAPEAEAADERRRSRHGPTLCRHMPTLGLRAPDSRLRGVGLMA